MILEHLNRRTKKCPVCGEKLKLINGCYRCRYSLEKTLSGKVCDYIESTGNVKQKMSIQILREYYYKYGYWREGEKVKCKYLGKLKRGDKIV